MAGENDKAPYKPEANIKFQVNCKGYPPRSPLTGRKEDSALRAHLFGKEGNIMVGRWRTAFLDSLRAVWPDRVGNDKMEVGDDKVVGRVVNSPSTCLRPRFPEDSLGRGICKLLGNRRPLFV